MAKKFGMFSSAGNKKVGGLVYKAKKAGLSWAQVEAQLDELAEMKGFKEASDSVVRDAAYVAMGFAPGLSEPPVFSL